MDYIIPNTNLLNCNANISTGKFDSEKLLEMSKKLEGYLTGQGVNVKVTESSQYGSESYLFEIVLAVGTRVNSITKYKQELSVLFSADDIDFLIPVPGKTCLGIVVTYSGNRNTLLLGDIIRKTNFLEIEGLKIVLGRTLEDRFVVYDFEQLPHLLIAGTTGSGKSVFMDSILISLMYKLSPEDIRFILVDTHSINFSMYKNIPHLLMPVITEPKKVEPALEWVVSEMMERYNKFSTLGVRNIESFNMVASAKMSHVMVIIDDLADVMTVSGAMVENHICKLSQMSRAAGIHLVISTQRPTTNVITGLIKANMPNRIAFSMAANIDSRTVLDEGGAEKLKGKGELFYKSLEHREPIKLQAPYISDDELSDVVSDIVNKNAGLSINFIEVSSESEYEMEIDDLFIQAGNYVVETNIASIGNIQRKFRIGFNRAAKIMDQLCDAGVVSVENGTKPRTVLMSQEQFDYYIETNI